MTDLESLMTDPGSVAEAVMQRDRAQELLIAILELIPSIDRDDSPQVGSLLNLVRGLEKEIVAYMLPIAARDYDREQERKEAEASLQRFLDLHYRRYA